MSKYGRYLCLDCDEFVFGYQHEKVCQVSHRGLGTKVVYVDTGEPLNE